MNHITKVIDYSSILAPSYLKIDNEYIAELKRFSIAVNAAKKRKVPICTYREPKHKLPLEELRAAIHNSIREAHRNYKTITSISIHVCYRMDIESEGFKYQGLTTNSAPTFLGFPVKWSRQTVSFRVNTKRENKFLPRKYLEELYKQDSQKNGNFSLQTLKKRG